MLLLTILISAITFVLGFIVGRAQALSILKEVENMLNRQRSIPVVVVKRDEDEEELDDEDDEDLN